MQKESMEHNTYAKGYIVKNTELNNLCETSLLIIIGNDKSTKK